MTIDEAIAHEREVAAIQRNNDKLNKTLGVISPYYKTDCIKCAEEHEQLAEWLEELKAYKKNSNTCPMCDTYCSYLAEEFENGYNKAIDDFATDIINKINFEDKWLFECKSNNADTNIVFSALRTFINERAEQLKVGGAR